MWNFVLNLILQINIIALAVWVLIMLSLFIFSFARCLHITCLECFVFLHVETHSPETFATLTSTLGFWVHICIIILFSFALELKWVGVPGSWRVQERNFPDASGSSHQCTICGKTFLVRDSLYKHKNIHKGMTQCPICQAVLSRTGNMRRHMVSKHGWST